MWKEYRLRTFPWLDWSIDQGSGQSLGGERRIRFLFFDEVRERRENGTHSTWATIHKFLVLLGGILVADIVLLSLSLSGRKKGWKMRKERERERNREFFKMISTVWRYSQLDLTRISFWSWEVRPRVQARGKKGKKKIGLGRESSRHLKRTTTKLQIDS